MKITNRMTDMENPSQINYGLRFNDFMRNGEIYLDSYKSGDNSRHWSYLIRKGFDFSFNDFASQGMLKAMVENPQTGEITLKDIKEVVNDAYNNTDKKYQLVGFKCDENLNVEQREKLECNLIVEFVNASENLDLNREGHEFYIYTHAFGEVVYVSDGSKQGVDKVELGKKLGIETFNSRLRSDFTNDIKARDRQLYGNFKSEKTTFTKNDIVDALFTTLNIANLRSNKGLYSSLLNEVDDLQQIMYDKDEFNKEEFDTLVSCFSKNEQGIVLSTFEGENEKIKLTNERKTSVEVKENGNVVRTTYLRGQWGNVDGRLKKNVEEYSAEGQQQSLVKYHASYSRMIAPSIESIDSMIKSNDMSEERYIRQNNAIVVDKTLVASYNYPHIKKEVYKKERYAYESTDSNIEAKNADEVKNILPEIDQNLDDVDFLDVVDDYLTGVNLMSDYGKNKFRHYIHDKIKNNDIATNIKLYDELMTRFEQNENAKDNFVSRTAGEFASDTYYAIYQKMENLTEAESGKLLSDLQSKVIYDKGVIEGLELQEASSKRDEKIKAAEHRVATYSKFANELVSQREKE